MKKHPILLIFPILTFLLIFAPVFAEGEEAENDMPVEISYPAPRSPDEVFESGHYQYVFGDGKGYFAPDEPLSRAAAYSLVYNILKDKSEGDIITDYSDCPPEAWYALPAKVLGSKGYLALTEGELCPLDEISRAEFSGILSMILGADESAECSFPDVPKESEYYIPIASAAERGWLLGSNDGLFYPDESLTRAQCVTILNRILGRVGDGKTEEQMDERYTFKDLPRSHWAYRAVMEAATSHELKSFDGSEVWLSYSHRIYYTPDWENSESVVNAAKITNELSCVYGGDYTHNYNIDYSTAFKEAFVNDRGYASKTGMMVWVSLQNQKVYVFSGSKGRWSLIKTFLGASGAEGHGTPICETYVTYRQYKWWFPEYTCQPIVRFKPGTGYAFHSRPYSKDGSGLYDSSIGQPASLGCIRMLDEDILYLYENLPDFSTVVIY